MFGLSAFERNKKTLEDAGTQGYTREHHAVYVQTLKSFGLKPISLKKFGKQLIASGLYVGFVDQAGNLTEEHTNTQRMSKGYAEDLPKYCQAMEKATGFEITASASMQTAWFTRSGWKGEFNYRALSKPMMMGNCFYG